MPTRKPLSFAAVTVLKAIADGDRYGFDIMDGAGLASGTVYPILSQLEKAGLVRARWESGAVAFRAGRPRRRYYQVTAAGAKALTLSIEHYRTLGGMIPLRTPRPARG